MLKTILCNIIYPSATKKSSLDATATSVGLQNLSVSSLLLAGSNFLPSTRDGFCLLVESNLNTCNHAHVSEPFLRATAYAIARICHANSVCLSVWPPVCYTRVSYQNGCENLTASLQRGRQIQGGSNFRSICGYISQMVIDWGSYYGRRI